MNRNERFRIYGARLNRFAHRFFIFVGMLALFSLVVGASAEGEARRITGIVLILALCVGIVILWFTSRSQRELDRSQQLAAETALLFPYADAGERDQKYTLRKRREKRLEALFYLILAVITGLWFWAMYAVEADKASWVIGGTVILPGLLLISAVLFILSLLPVSDDEEMPAVSKQEQLLTQSILKYSGPQPDHEGVQIVHALTLEDECKTAEEYLQRERSSQRGDTLLLKVGMWFFFIVPLILFVLSFAVAAGGGPKWFMLFTGILALASTALWIFMTHVPGGKGSATSASRRMKQLKSREYRVIRDTILSHRLEEDAAEIEFAQCGKVRVPCHSKDQYIRYFCVPRHAAIVAIYKGRIQSIALLRDDDEAEAAAPLQEEADSDVDLDTIMSDEALHEAALREIENMSPSRRREMEVEIEHMLNVTTSDKPYSERTTLEQGEWHQAVSTDLHRSDPDISMSAIESYITEQLKVPRSAIPEMKENPFAPAVRRRLLIAVAAGIGGALVTAVIEKTTGSGLGFLYLIFSVLTGGIAMSCADDISTMGKFRKLQKAYQDPKYRRKVLDAAVYREIREQVKQRRGIE